MTGGEGLSRNPFVRRSSQRVGRTSWSTGSAWHKRPGVYGHCYCLTRDRTQTAVYHHSPTYIVTSLKTEDGKQKAHWKELFIFELTNRLHTHNQLHQEDINKSYKKTLLYIHLMELHHEVVGNASKANSRGRKWRVAPAPSDNTTKQNELQSEPLTSHLRSGHRLAEWQLRIVRRNEMPHQLFCDFLDM